MPFEADAYKVICLPAVSRRELTFAQHVLLKNNVSGGDTGHSIFKSIGRPSGCAVGVFDNTPDELAPIRCETEMDEKVIPVDAEDLRVEGLPDFRQVARFGIREIHGQQRVSSAVGQNIYAAGA